MECWCEIFCPSYHPANSIKASDGGKEGGRPGRHFAGAAFEGRKFGILAFALQCARASQTLAPPLIKACKEYR